MCACMFACLCVFQVHFVLMCVFVCLCLGVCFCPCAHACASVFMFVLDVFLYLRNCVCL